MTLGEIIRECTGIVYRTKEARKEKAMFDYTQAQLIVSGVAKCLGGKSKYPDIYEAYPEIYERPVEQKTDVSVARFLAFAERHNRKVSDNK